MLEILKVMSPMPDVASVIAYDEVSHQLLLTFSSPNLEFCVTISLRKENGELKLDSPGHESQIIQYFTRTEAGPAACSERFVDVLTREPLLLSGGSTILPDYPTLRQLLLSLRRFSLRPSRNENDPDRRSVPSEPPDLGD